MKDVGPITLVQLRTSATSFFNQLHRFDLHDHPEVFRVLDDIAREQGYAIRAEQKGVFGIKLSFCRVEEL